MGALKTFMSEQDELLHKLEGEQVEVIGDTVDECLKLASKHLRKQIHQLDYIVLKRGKKNFFFGEPYHIRVSILPDDESYDDLIALDKKLTGGSGKLLSTNLKELIVPKNKDGWVCLKNYKSGVWLTIFPPKGEGRRVTQDEVVRRLSHKGITDVNQSLISKSLKEESGEPVRIADSKIKAGMEGKIMVDISADKMKAMVTLIPPKPNGRDLEVSDIVSTLKNSGIRYGIKEEEIKNQVEADTYNIAFLAATGDPPVNGKNASIVYHVRTEKVIEFKEDSFGKVDYRNMDLIENVVVGQLLAEKIPPEKGKWGRDLYNQLLEAKDGVDIQLKQGKGTILSEDRSKLTAEVNGQVLFLNDKLSVETIYRINGDVGNRTGNITFLGSIIITGNIEDNFQVKAAGNIEVYGTVQKAIVEADGDIVIRQGVTGRGEAKIESTSGNIVAKFIQNATVTTDKDVIVQEGIMHSEISAGGKIACQGKRGQIVGGVSKAGNLIVAKVIGSKANPQTDLVVGFNPKISKQIADYEAKKEENKGKLDQIQKSLKTLKARKEADPSSFSEENAAHMVKLEQGGKKLHKRITEYEQEIQTLQNYLEETSEHGKISVEKILFGGVFLRIKNAEYRVKNEIKTKTFYQENGLIKQMPYEDPNPAKADWRKKRSKDKKPSNKVK
ncbi:MAG: FapA family protein [Leptospiraceae bacterium]|nr:FapA family protein [Leptospiraceae bacterium]MCK6380408.1 FapA family protein [Leptospiraceae bacterium]NUM41563.1 FapA family protein [Leptospiraceae bacterium]